MMVTFHRAKSRSCPTISLQVPLVASSGRPWIPRVGFFSTSGTVFVVNSLSSWCCEIPNSASWHRRMVRHHFPIMCLAHRVYQGLSCAPQSRQAGRHGWAVQGLRAQGLTTRSWWRSLVVGWVTVFVKTLETDDEWTVVEALSTVFRNYLGPPYVWLVYVSVFAYARDLRLIQINNIAVECCSLVPLSPASYQFLFRSWINRVTFTAPGSLLCIRLQSRLSWWSTKWLAAYSKFILTKFT